METKKTQEQGLLYTELTFSNKWMIMKIDTIWSHMMDFSLFSHCGSLYNEIKLQSSCAQ